MRRTLFDELHLACVCPHGQRSWWGDRVCPEFDARLSPERYLLGSVLPFFDERWGLRPRRAGSGTEAAPIDTLLVCFRNHRG